MNDYLFIFGQYPVSYLLTLVWYKGLLPLAPEPIQFYRGYTVVRVVDYLKDDKFYITATNCLYFSFLLYYTYSTNDYWFIYLAFTSWIGVLGMELALQLSGKRRIELDKTRYSSRYYILTVLQQTLREGTVYFGLPSLTIQGCMPEIRARYPSMMVFSIMAVLLNFHAVRYFFSPTQSGSRRRLRKLGSTNVVGRRPVLDTLFYRVAELYVTWYIFSKYTDEFVIKWDFIKVVTFYRTVNLGVFFSTSTYLGTSYVDRGPNVPCSDTWLLNVSGVLFRIFESTLVGYPKHVALTIMLDKAIQKSFK
jgi:hypothetical protein